MAEDFLAKGISSVIVIVVAVLLFLFWITMFADCVGRTFKKRFEKFLWVLAFVFLQVPGAFIYWLAVKRKT